MEAKCTSSNREMILCVLQRETNAKVNYAFSPSFAYSVGGYTLTRDGRICSDSDDPGIFSKLSSLGLCDYPYTPPIPAQAEYFYPMSIHTGCTLTNLLFQISARHNLLNSAIGSPGAFYVCKDLIYRIQEHPPVSKEDFLQILYLSEKQDPCRGIRFTLTYIQFNGFCKSRKIASKYCHQLADHMIHTALSQSHVKPFTCNIRNKKYAMHTWLNAIGMRGDSYQNARFAFTNELQGSTERKTFAHRKENSDE